MQFFCVVDFELNILIFTFCFVSSIFVFSNSFMSFLGTLSSFMIQVCFHYWFIMQTSEF